MGISNLATLSIRECFLMGDNLHFEKFKNLLYGQNIVKNDDFVDSSPVTELTL